MDSTYIQDMRKRLVQVRQYEANGEPIPEGLRPTDEELKQALELAAEGRGKASEAAKPKSKINADTDLSSLFS